jgi:uncharacterized protein YidB (DUF937 family)
MELKRKVVVGAVAAIAVGGAGAGVAATRVGRSPSEESKAVISDAAKQLGIEPTRLSSALKKALEDHVDAAVADGRLTKAEGDALKQRIESGQFPLLGSPAFGFHRHFGGPDGMRGLSAAASYLGLNADQLRTQLQSGKTLAQVAKAQGKSVEGLVAVLKADLKMHLDRAVADGRLTKAQEDRILSSADQRITSLVNGKLMRPPRPEGWFGGRPDRSFGGGPPAGAWGPPAA